MFYNIQNNNALRYLCDLIPPTIQSTTVYPLRNGSDIYNIILQTDGSETIYAWDKS
jgi:hypothetical protein